MARGGKGNRISGTNGNDVLLGTNETDSINGRGGDDQLTGAGGNDKLVGGKGFDTALYTGSILDYSITISNKSVTVTDLNLSDGDDGTDKLSGIELIQFSDGSISLTGANSPPVAQDDTASVDADGSSTILATHLLANDFDPDSDPLSVANATVTSGLGTASVVAGDVVYDPAGAYDYLAAGENATVLIDYTVSDGNGGMDTGELTMTVNGVNEAPTAVDDTASTDADTALQIDVAADDTDTDTSDTLSATAASITSGLGSVSIVSGEVSYDPAGAYEYLAAGEHATVLIDYTVSDGNGGMDTGELTLTVNGLNEAPTAVDDTASTDADTAVQVDVAADDTDTDTTDTLSATAASITSGLGSVSIVSGEVAYDPAGAYDHLVIGENADVLIDYTVSDGNGGSDTGTLTVTVNGIVGAPVAVDDTYSTDADTIVDLFVLANDYDTDSSDPLILDTDGLSISGYGSVIAFDPGSLEPPQSGPARLVYDPTASTEGHPVANPYGYLGVGESVTVVISYTIEDADGLTDVGEATVTVNGVNDAPEAGAAPLIVTTEYQSIEFSIAPPSDIDGDTLTMTITGLPGNGTVNLLGGAPLSVGMSVTETELATLTFVPYPGVLDPNYPGEMDEQFLTYDIDDGTTQTEGSVTLVTYSGNFPTTYVPPNYLGDTILVGSDWVDGIVGGRGDDIIYSGGGTHGVYDNILGDDFGGTAIDTDTVVYDGNFEEYTFNGNINDTLLLWIKDPTHVLLPDFSYYIRDGWDALRFIETLQFADVTIRVGSFTYLDEDTPTTFTYSQLTAWVGGGITSIDGSQNGAAIDNGDGTVTFTPDADFSGSALITYTSTLGFEASTILTVDPITDIPIASATNVTGLAGTWIPLAITGTSSDIDGSETVTVKIQGLPAGSILSAGTAVTPYVWELTEVELAGLQVNVPAALTDQNITIYVTVYANDIPNGQEFATASMILTATAGYPIVSLPATLEVYEDANTPLTISVTEVDPALFTFNGVRLNFTEPTSVFVSGTPVAPEGDGSFIIAASDIGAVTFTPNAQSDTDFEISISTIATEIATSTSTETPSGGVTEVTVDAVADTPTFTYGDVTGDQDTLIPLDLSAALIDLDGSEALTVRITLPAGSELWKDGLLLVAVSVETPYSITGSDAVSGLSFKPPLGAVGTITLAVEVVVIDTPTEGVLTFDPENPLNFWIPGETDIFNNSVTLNASIDVAVIPTPAPSSTLAYSIEQYEIRAERSFGDRSDDFIFRSFDRDAKFSSDHSWKSFDSGTDAYIFAEMELGGLKLSTQDSYFDGTESSAKQTSDYSLTKIGPDSLGDLFSDVDWSGREDPVLSDHLFLQDS